MVHYISLISVHTLSTSLLLLSNHKACTHLFITESLQILNQLLYLMKCLLSRDKTQLELRHRFEGHNLGVISVDVDHSGQIAASSSIDSVINVWDINGGKLSKSLDTNKGMLLCIHLCIVIVSLAQSYFL